MAFPIGWPPKPASSNRSIRAFKSSATTTDWADNAFIFSDLPGANTYTAKPVVRAGLEMTQIDIGTSPSSTSVAQICANTIQVTNDGSVDIEVTFDGTNIQGIVKQSETICWRDRREAGIAVRTASSSSAYRIEAW